MNQASEHTQSARAKLIAGLTILFCLGRQEVRAAEASRFKSIAIAIACTVKTPEADRQIYQRADGVDDGPSWRVSATECVDRNFLVKGIVPENVSTKYDKETALTIVQVEVSQAAAKSLGAMSERAFFAPPQKRSLLIIDGKVVFASNLGGPLGGTRFVWPRRTKSEADALAAMFRVGR